MDLEDLPPGVPAVGDVLSEKYRVERVLGMGGMGVVLAARHVTLGQAVAIKMLRPEIAKLPEAAERFLREARASTNLRSQHVAHVLDVGALPGGAPYMVMEFLEGRDLHELARSQAVPLAAAVEYVLQAAEGLAEAHGAGIVHRDLKPANLFLTAGPDGSPLIKVLDFGISKATMPGERGITATDAVLGSPGYMAPEQIRSAKSVDQRADVWGLGVCLFELLTSMPPFDGASVAAVSVQIVMEAPKLVHELRPDAPEGLSAVVQRCLEKDPAHRFSNMAELAAALLPFAPPGSEAAVERIRRIVRGSVAFAETINAADPALASTVAAATGGAWGRTEAASPRARRMALGVGGALGAIAILAAVYGLGRRSGEPTRESNGSSTAATASDTSTSRSPTADAALGSESTRASTHAAPSAPEPTAAKVEPGAAAGPGTRRTGKTPSTRPVCAKGQSASNGHCCPKGLVWQKNGCDRPLAVTLP